mmetsp:Transcript_10530/g.33513  ORF Transcript_10530/g.33513 Transcript_10530/m.33513 type:complete len:268 (-) Transcript_10530:97-900(-)
MATHRAWSTTSGGLRHMSPLPPLRPGVPTVLGPQRVGGRQRGLPGRLRQPTALVHHRRLLAERHRRRVRQRVRRLASLRNVPRAALTRCALPPPLRGLPPPPLPPLLPPPPLHAFAGCIPLTHRTSACSCFSGDETVIAEQRLPAGFTNGYQTTTLNLTYHFNSSRVVCRGDFEIWWVLRTRSGRVLELVKPFHVELPRCFFDVVTQEYLPYVELQAVGKADPGPAVLQVQLPPGATDGAPSRTSGLPSYVEDEIEAAVYVAAAADT